jgi:hypothetical protein
MAEGLAIEKLIEARGLSTYTPRLCASACLLAFMGGHDRYLGTQGRLGFHQASVAGVGGAIASQGTGQFRSAFSSKGVPPAFIDRALSTPPSSMWYPPKQELLDSHVITAVVDENDYALTGIKDWDDRGALERQFSRLPVFAAIRKLDPSVFTELEDNFVTGVQQGLSQTEMSGRVHTAVINKIIPRYLPRAPDRALLAYWQVQLTEIRELQARDPKLCVAFLFSSAGDPSLVTMLSRPTRDMDRRRLSDLLVAVAQAPETVPPLATVQPALAAALRQAERSVPGSLNRISHPDRWKASPSELCESELAFYDAIQQLPASQAGLVLRYVLGNASHQLDERQALGK